MRSTDSLVKSRSCMRVLLRCVVTISVAAVFVVGIQKAAESR